MAFSDSRRRQIEAGIPPVTETPTVPAHLQGLVDKIEEHLVLRAPSWDWAEVYLVPYIDGMLLYIEDQGTLNLRREGAWYKIWPWSYNGVEPPPDSLGTDGDLYFQTVP